MPRRSRPEILAKPRPQTKTALPGTVQPVAGSLDLGMIVSVYGDVFAGRRAPAAGAAGAAASPPMAENEFWPTEH